MIPTHSSLKALGAWLALALLAAFKPALVPVWTAVGWGLLGLMVLDALLLFRIGLPAITRKIPLTLPLGVWCEVHLAIQNKAVIAQRVQLFDGCPAGLELQGMPQCLTLPARGHATLIYQVRPHERGIHAFDATDLKVGSPLGLWWRLCKVGESTPVRVYPNFATVKKFAALATHHHLAQLGVHRKRRRGEGMEFHQLREYRQGDSLRQIDWKATSRMRKLISKDYQDERDQQVVVLLDCGRRMRTLDESSNHDELPLSHFDHTLNAVLLLTYVALREGDAVGLQTFGGHDRWLPPRKGTAALNQALEALFDIEAKPCATDYLAGAEHCLARLTKRSLVVLVTALRDEDEDTLLPAVALLRQRHRVLVVSLRERALEETLKAPIQEFDDALRHGAIFEYLDQRRRAFDRLRARGVRALDLLPDQLPLALVNKYLEIKRSGAL